MYTQANMPSTTCTLGTKDNSISLEWTCTRMEGKASTNTEFLLYAEPYASHQGSFKRLLLQKLMLILFSHIQSNLSIKKETNSICFPQHLWAQALEIFSSEQWELLWVPDWGLCVPFVGLDHRVGQSFCSQIPFFADSLHLPRTQIITYSISPILSCVGHSHVRPIFTFNIHRGRYQMCTICNTESKWLYLTYDTSWEGDGIRFSPHSIHLPAPSHPGSLPTWLPSHQTRSS